jgi:Lar family restriction alleviation protein
MMKLKPCPFCNDKHIRVTKTMDLDGDISYQTMCLHCGATAGHPRMSKEAAIKAWNSRTPLEDAPEPCSCPTVRSPGIIICGTCGGEVV